MARQHSQTQKSWAFLWAVFILVVLAACQSQGPDGRTPAPTIQSPALVPQEVPMTTLLRNPASFKGQTIRVTGQYRSLPLLVCGETTHRSPATWTLVFGDVQVLAAGFDQALRPLAVTGLSLTVEGRWQQWQGPVGCGRRAPTEEIWYLAASRIVAPNPLVKGEDDQTIVLVPSPTSDSQLPGELPTPDGLPVITPTSANGTTEPDDGGETTPPTLTPSPTFQTIPQPLPGATSTPTPRPTNTPGTGGDATNTPTLTPAGTGTATTTPGGTPGTGTPTTATPVGTTPSATSVPSDQGTTTFDEIQKSALTAGTPHTWRFTVASGEVITITAGATTNLNISLDLLAPDGTAVGKANEGAAGRPETIVYTTTAGGEYQIIVTGDGGTAGNYVMVLQNSDSEPWIVMRDTILYGAGGTGTAPAGFDHYWNFEGQAGDIITIIVTASNSGDLFLSLIGPDGSLLEEVDDTGQGSNETLASYTLPATGFYSIGIGEFDFLEVSYVMTLAKNN
jgi:hypothetical protein